MKRGFTLIELLVVVGILGATATIAVLLINPTELFKQSRDTQRIADLKSLQSSIDLYLATVQNPVLAKGPSSPGNTDGVWGFGSDDGPEEIYCDATHTGTNHPWFSSIELDLTSADIVTLFSGGTKGGGCSLDNVNNVLSPSNPNPYECIFNKGSYQPFVNPKKQCDILGPTVTTSDDGATTPDVCDGTQPDAICMTDCGAGWIYQQVTANGEGLSQGENPVVINNVRAVDGTGWIPIELNKLSAGAAPKKLPIDPLNNAKNFLILPSPTTEIAQLAGVNGLDGSHFYAYQCKGLTYELNANMESEKYGYGGSADVESTDGGGGGRFGKSIDGAAVYSQYDISTGGTQYNPESKFISKHYYEVGNAPGLSL